MGVAAVPLIMTAVGAGVSAYNTKQTAKKQDKQLATQIRNQSTKQKQADQRLNQELETMKQSTSAEARTKRMGDYTQALQRGRKAAVGGLEAPMIGGSAFVSDSANAASAVDATGTQTADWMSRIDAPGLQRTTEGRGIDMTGQDFGITAREAKGQNYLDELKLRSIRRNPWLDMASGLLTSGAGMYGSAGKGK